MRESRGKAHGVVIFCQAQGDISKLFGQEEIALAQNEVPIEPTELMQAMARLGLADWELVSASIASTSASRSNVLFFKRPVEPGRATDDAF